MSTTWGQPREDVQCYELFEGIALKITPFYINFATSATMFCVVSAFVFETKAHIMLSK